MRLPGELSAFAAARQRGQAKKSPDFARSGVTRRR